MIAKSLPKYLQLLFTNGGCAEFAAAVKELHGEDVRIVTMAVQDPYFAELHDYPADEQIEVHTFALDQNGMAIDAEGRRTVADLAKSFGVPRKAHYELQDAATCKPRSWDICGLATQALVEHGWSRELAGIPDATNDIQDGFRQTRQQLSKALPLIQASWAYPSEAERDATPPWQLTLQEYLAPSQVSFEHFPLTGEKDVEDFSQILPALKKIPTPHRPDLDIRYIGTGRYAAGDARNGDILGAYMPTHPFVFPDHRGRGICAEMHVAADVAGHRRKSYTYTESGFYARQAAHRLHVERALERGENVPDAVLSEYARTDSGLKLRAPYTPKAHMTWTEQEVAREAIERHAEASKDYSAVFQSGRDQNRRELQYLMPDYGGLLLALELHREFGCHFHVTRQNDAIAIQSILEDDVIDVAGIRPRDKAGADLVQRGFMRPAPAEDIIIETEIDLLRWLQPGEPDSIGRYLPKVTEAECDAVRETVYWKKAYAALEWRVAPSPA